MDGAGDGPACKISVRPAILLAPRQRLTLPQMLWNWYTIDACFLSAQWHVRTGGMFAATCVGVVLLVVLVEFLRRLGREYDALLLRQFGRAAAARRHDGGPAALRLRASVAQQLVRAALHAATFGAAYVVMLLAMYFNGYVIVSIFVGAGLGKFVCDWLEVTLPLGGDDEGAGGAGGEGGVKGIEEPSVCCG